MSHAETRASYVHFTRLDTRWHDNDVYGHVNNVVYYAFFDTAVNGHLIRAGCLDVQASAVIGLVVETQCRYFKPIAFPDVNDDESAAAQGHFVHVYVDRAANRPVPIPDGVRRALAALMRAQ
jgi:acyl-CoA thioester hydrolase